MGIQWYNAVNSLSECGCILYWSNFASM